MCGCLSVRFFCYHITSLAPKDLSLFIYKHIYADYAIAMHFLNDT